MKTATIYGYHGAEQWRYVVEYRDKKLADLNGVGWGNGKATLHAWLTIKGFTHYRFGPNGKKQTCNNLK